MPKATIKIVPFDEPITAPIKIVRFEIPNTSQFPDEYKGGFADVGVFPALGVMPFVLDREGGLERLEDWALNNILLGFIEGQYTETFLREDRDLIKITSREGEVLLDTFSAEYDYERWSPIPANKTDGA